MTKRLPAKGKEKAERVLDFVSRYCTHTKGKWAGKPFEILPWQEELIRNYYGTLKSDGYRRYRYLYLEIPKKNGKTELGAALCLYHLIYDDEWGAEVYNAAADKEQASLCYNVAAQMVHNKPALSKRLDVIDSRKRIVDPKMGGAYQVLSAEAYTKHGINPSMIFFDEVHAQPNDDLWRVLTAGTDYARAQQTVMAATTAGVYDKTSLWWRIRERARQIDDGTITDPSWLPILYLADPDTSVDDPHDENLWIRVNPSLGQIFTLDKIRADYLAAKDDPVDWNDFLRFRLNVPVAAISRWIAAAKWDACGGVVREEDLVGKVCVGGLDLSNEWDISAWVLLFPPQEGLDRYTVLPRFYVPEENMMERVRRDRVNYDIWAREGWITATPGNVIDHRFILHQIDQDCEKFDLRELAFDRWGATFIIQSLIEMGFQEESDKGYNRKLIRFGQGYASMSRPTKTLRKLVTGGELNHGNNPVLDWMSNNLVLESDAAFNLKPNKSRSVEKIDGMVALIMAVDRACLDMSGSIYEEQELMIL